MKKNKCKICSGGLGGFKDFHPLCKARAKRGVPTPRINPPKPMTKEEQEAELIKAGIPLDQFTFIKRGS